MLAAVRQYSFTGVCFGVYFSLLIGVDDKSLSVTELVARVSPDAAHELDAFIQYVQTEYALLPFFRGFSRYCRLRQARMDLFRTLLQDYPDHTSLGAQPLELSRRITIGRRRGAVRDAIQVELLWLLEAQQDGTVKSRVSLVVSPLRKGTARYELWQG